MNDRIFTKTPIVCVTALFCCALWGSASPAIKTGYAMFGINSADIAAQILFAGLLGGWLFAPKMSNGTKIYLKFFLISS